MERKLGQQVKMNTASSPPKYKAQQKHQLWCIFLMWLELGYDCALSYIRPYTPSLNTYNVCILSYAPLKIQYSADWHSIILMYWFFCRFRLTSLSRQRLLQRLHLRKIWKLIRSITMTHSFLMNVGQLTARQELVECNFVNHSALARVSILNWRTFLLVKVDIIWF